MQLVFYILYINEYKYIYKNADVMEEENKMLRYIAEMNARPILFTSRFT